MARIQEIRLVDDLDHSEAVETVEFSLGDKRFEIDLSEENASLLRRTLAPFVSAARRVDRPDTAVRSRSASGRAREEAHAIREWAHSHGMPLSDRGRIPTEVRAAYARRASEPLAAAPGKPATSNESRRVRRLVVDEATPTAHKTPTRPRTNAAGSTANSSTATRAPRL